MYKVLLIEDDFFVNDIYTRNFKKRGYQVTSALSGEAGITATQTEKYDLVLLDIMMPGKTGLEVLKELKASSPSLPIVLFTNLAQTAIIQEALRAGATGYILKGGKSPKEIINKIDYFLKTKESGIFESL